MTHSHSVHWWHYDVAHTACHPIGYTQYTITPRNPLPTPYADPTRPHMLNPAHSSQFPPKNDYYCTVKLIVDMTLASKIAVYYNLPPVLSHNRCLPRRMRSDASSTLYFLRPAMLFTTYKYLFLINFHKNENTCFTPENQPSWIHTKLSRIRRL